MLPRNAKYSSTDSSIAGGAFARKTSIILPNYTHSFSHEILSSFCSHNLFFLLYVILSIRASFSKTSIYQTMHSRSFVCSCFSFTIFRNYFFILSTKLQIIFDCRDKIKTFHKPIYFSIVVTKNILPYFVYQTPNYF